LPELVNALDSLPKSLEALDFPHGCTRSGNALKAPRADPCEDAAIRITPHNARAAPRPALWHCFPLS